MGKYIGPARLKQIWAKIKDSFAVKDEVYKEWTANVIANTWCKICSIHGYGAFLFTFTGSQAGYSTCSSFIINTGWSNGNISQINYNGFQGNANLFKFRITKSANNTFSLEMYSPLTFAYCRVIKLNKNTENDTNTAFSLTPITTATAGGGDVLSEITNSYNTAANFNADMVDGKHASEFATRGDADSVDLNTVNGEGFLYQGVSAKALPTRNYPIQEAGALIYGNSAYNRSNQIYGTFNSNRWFARGGGGGLGSTDNGNRTSWREFAFLDRVATESSNGVMSADDKNILDYLRYADKNKYVLSVDLTRYAINSIALDKINIFKIITSVNGDGDGDLIDSVINMLIKAAKSTTTNLHGYDFSNISFQVRFNNGVRFYPFWYSNTEECILVFGVDSDNLIQIYGDESATYSILTADVYSNM